MPVADLAPNGSIARGNSLRPNLLIFEILAKITKADIEWMSHAVDAAFEIQQEVDMLIVMRRFDGQEVGALFDGEAIKVQTKSLNHVRRYAVVGAPGWAELMIELMDKVLPVDAKTFNLEDEAAARAWVDRPPNPA